MPILADAWLNDWDDPVNFQCPSGQSMSRIKSEHNNDKEDRRWNLYCSRVPVPGSLSNCGWTGKILTQAHGKQCLRLSVFLFLCVCVCVLSLIHISEPTRLA